MTAAALGLCGLPGAAFARGVTADSVLRRLVEGPRAVNLRGKQVVMITGPQSPGRATAKQITRSADGRCLTVSTEPASERGVVTVDDGTYKRTYDPRRKTVMVSRSMARAATAAAIARRLRLIRHNYTVRLAGSETIAGRKCNRLEMVPHHPISHPVRVWVDALTGVVLCYQESDWRGNTVGLTLFTSIEYPRTLSRSKLSYRFPRSAKVIAMSRSTLHRDVSALRRLVGFDVTLPLAMPGGFEFDNAEAVAMGSTPTACLRFTDGVANITVCESRSRAIRPTTFRRMECRKHPMGDIMVSYACGPLDIMVIGHGEIPGLAAVAEAIDGGKEAVLMSDIQRHYGASPSVLRTLRNTGLGLDDMLALLEIASVAHRPLASLVDAFRQGVPWEQIARSHHVEPSRIADLIRPLYR